MTQLPFKIRPIAAEGTPNSFREDAAVGKLLVDSFVETYAKKMPHVVVTQRRIESLMDVTTRKKTGTILVMEIEGKIVGSVALFGPEHAQSDSWIPNYAGLRHFVVSPSFQGKGLATHLLQAAHNLVRDQGFKGVCIHVRRGAEGLVRFYTRHGYVRDLSGDLDQLPQIFLEGFHLNFLKG